MHGLCETEKEKKHEDLAVAKHVALTCDYWTSVSNINYLGVTGHLNTTCIEHLTVAHEWEIGERKKKKNHNCRN